MPLAELVPKGDPDLAVFIMIMLAGFIVGTAGHVIRSRTLVIIGIVAIFASTVVLPLLIFRGGR
jgi:hypothetical protein